MRITRTAAAGLYIVIAIVLGGVLGQHSLPTYWRLYRLGQPVRAVVERTQCDNHGSVFYRFEVGGQEYKSVGNAGFGIPECGDLKPGDQIVVYYLPSTPNVSRPGEISARWNNELIAVGLAVTILPAIGVSLIWRQFGGRRRVGKKR